MTILISGFIAAFLVIFKPFGLSEAPYENRNLIAAGYGLVTFFFMIIDLFLLPALPLAFFNESKWTVGKQIIMSAIILFSIGFGNALYTSWFLGQSKSLELFMWFQVYTLVIGIIPFAFMTIIMENRLVKQHLAASKAITDHVQSSQEPHHEKQVDLQTDNKPFSLNIDDLLYLESMSNYVKLVYLQNGEAKSEILRATLSDLSKQLEQHNHIVKCHRSFVVNTDKITDSKGNAQGLKLSLNNASDLVPVSRAHIPKIKEVMHV